MPLFALRLGIVQYDEIVAGVLKHWLSLGCLLGGLVVSEVLLRRLRAADDLTPWSRASVLLDVAVAFGVCLWGVLWPVASYPGFLSRPDWAVFPVLAVAGGLRLSRSATLVGSVAAAVAALSLVSIDMQRNAEVLVYGPADALLAVVFMVVGGLLGDAVASRVRRLVQEGASQAVDAERARHRLGTYVSEEVAALALASDATLGGSERQVAVLFSDLRGFTTYAESIQPDALVEELNAYLDAIVPAFRAERGVVDKYIGDAVMAVFGAPFGDGDEAGRAIRAAAGMRQALVRHNTERVARGLPPLSMGIGVHFGRVIAGNIGTEERLQYTVVGDTVNVASRLESATKTEGVPVLLSQAVVDEAMRHGSAIPNLVAHGSIDIRGRAAPLTVHTMEA